MAADPNDHVPAERPPLVIDHHDEVELVVSLRGAHVSSHVPLSTEVWVGPALGRGVTLAIPDMKVGRRHARFIFRDARVFIEDNASECGTYLDGTRIDGETEIREGAVVCFGTHEVRVIRREAGAPKVRPPLVVSR